MTQTDPSPPVGSEETPQRTLSEVLAGKVILDVQPTHIVISDDQGNQLQTVPQYRNDQSPDLRELSSTGETKWGGYWWRQEYNPELQGEKGLQTYDKMRRSDGFVRGSLRLVKTPVLAARWYVQAVSDSPQDQEIARYVWKNLTSMMSTSWSNFLTESLLMLDFGYYAFEKVFAVLPDGTAYWKKFAPIHPLDVFQWNFDANGGPAGVDLYAPPGDPDNVYIPIKKLAVFTFDKEAGNIEGISILRSAYKHWYFKDQLYKIDAIQKERHGIGIPVIKLPPNFNPTDRNLADEIGRNLRTNERAHVVLPPNWEIEFAKIEGQPVDAMVSIEHHNKMIYANVLAELIDGDNNDFFVKGTRFVAEIVRDVINKYCIPQLVSYNWDVEEYPELRVRRLGDTTDWRTMSFALRNLIGAGVIVPDDDLEEWARDEMDVSRRDPSTARAVATPQLPQVGPPRQSTAPGNQQGTRTENVGRAGRDTSGG